VLQQKDGRNASENCVQSPPHLDLPPPPPNERNDGEEMRGFLRGGSGLFGSRPQTDAPAQPWSVLVAWPAEKERSKIQYLI